MSCSVQLSMTSFITLEPDIVVPCLDSIIAISAKLLVVSEAKQASLSLYAVSNPENSFFLVTQLHCYTMSPEKMA